MGNPQNTNPVKIKAHTVYVAYMFLSPAICGTPTHDLHADELSKCTYSTVLTTIVTKLMMRPISNPILTLKMTVEKKVMIQVSCMWLTRGDRESDFTKVTSTAPLKLLDFGKQSNNKQSTSTRYQTSKQYTQLQKAINPSWDGMYMLVLPAL